MADPELDERVREILDLMLRGEWQPGRSHHEFAAKCGVTPSAVRQWSASAARYLRIARGDEGEIRERLLANLDHAGVLALGLERPDLRSYIAAQELQARLHALLQPKRDGTNELVDVPTAELAELLRAQGYDVKGPDAERQPGIASDERKADEASED